MDSETRTRLFSERDDLRERINRLTSFVGTEQFDALSADDQRDLREQLDHMRPYLAVLVRRAERARHAGPPMCCMCNRERTINDAYDYNPLQAITGKPLGWYSGDDGEVCPECMTKMLARQ